MALIGVVDYDAGNLRSVETALKHLDAEFFISSKPEELEESERLIFPGVGEAAASMRNLKERGLDEFLRRYFASRRPILGICIGAQIVLSRSEERDTTCLDLVHGTAKRFPDKKGYKVPHMGWNSVSLQKESVLFEGIPNESSFYFVHSYYPEPEDAGLILTETEYGMNFVSAFKLDNLYAVQFHPEKSGKWGLQLIDNFIRKIPTADGRSTT